MSDLSWSTKGSVVCGLQEKVQGASNLLSACMMDICAAVTCGIICKHFRMRSKVSLCFQTVVHSPRQAKSDCPGRIRLPMLDSMAYFWNAQRGGVGMGASFLASQLVFHPDAHRPRQMHPLCDYLPISSLSMSLHLPYTYPSAPPQIAVGDFITKIEATKKAYEVSRLVTMDEFVEKVRATF